MLPDKMSFSDHVLDCRWPSAVAVARVSPEVLILLPLARPSAKVAGEIESEGTPGTEANGRRKVTGTVHKSLILFST